MKPTRPHARSVRKFDKRRNERGATLVVVMVLLLVMTLLGLASLRGTVLEERMSANLSDRGLAFQNAEAALREAEAVLDTFPAFPGAGCSAGLCGRPAGSATERWLDAGFAGWRTAATNDPKVDAPQFIVEEMGLASNPDTPGCSGVVSGGGGSQTLCETMRYRITARSSQNDRAAVLLQTAHAEFRQ
jgi:type IV pilus assembly protein PilX